MFLGSILPEGVKIEPERHETEDGKPYLYLTTTNAFGECPVKFKVVLDFDPMLRIVRRYVEKSREANPAVAELRAEFKKDVSDLRAEVKDLSTVMGGLSEVVLDKARKSFGDNKNALHCFNKLQDAILVALQAPKFASSGFFAIKATSQSALIAKNAAGLFAAVTEGASIIPGLTFASAATTYLVNEITLKNQVQRHKDVVKATEGMNLDKIATFCASIITARAQCGYYGEEIPEAVINLLIVNVKREINALRKGYNQAEISLQLSDKAVSLLPEPKVKLTQASPEETRASANSSGSSHSSNSSGAKVISFSSGSKKLAGSNSSSNSTGSGSPKATASDDEMPAPAIQDMLPARKTGMMRFICA